jgi:hypothetical protein
LQEEEKTPCIFELFIKVQSKDFWRCVSTHRDLARGLNAKKCNFTQRPIHSCNVKDGFITLDAIFTIKKMNSYKTRCPMLVTEGVPSQESFNVFYLHAYQSRRFTDTMVPHFEIFTCRVVTLCNAGLGLHFALLWRHTAVFANFVQFHHASPVVGRQHITSFITGRRPADLQPFYQAKAGSFGRQQFVYRQFFSLLPG